MDLRQLRYFVTLAEELHFGRAAERLGMTQPPLSQAILGLETELGVRLFTRTHRQVSLTPVGRQWLPHVRRVLADAAGLPELARQLLRGEIGTLTLAFVSTADYGVLPSLLSRYTTLHPGVQVTLREATSDVQIDALLKEEIDAGIVIATEQGKLHTSLAYLPLLRERLILALPHQWVQEEKVSVQGGKVSLPDVAAAPLLLFPRRHAPALHDRITGTYTARGLVPQFGQQAIQMQTIVSLVSAGLGVALVPESLRNLQRQGVTYVDLKEETPEIETGLVWRQRDRAPTLEHFVEVARSLLKIR